MVRRLPILCAWQKGSTNSLMAADLPVRCKEVGCTGVFYETPVCPFKAFIPKSEPPVYKDYNTLSSD